MCRSGLPNLLHLACVRSGTKSNESIGALDEDGVILLD